MYRIFILVLFFVFISVPMGFSKKPPDDVLYHSSLHYYARGMAYWYSSKTGGLERFIKIPYDKLGCNHCHARTCDTCHKTVINGIPTYSVKTAKQMKNCLRCHKREFAMLKLMKKLKAMDVHFAKGMTCVDCHSSKEIHGDGKYYISMREPGAMNTKCENCHKKIPQTLAHTIHKGKLGCTACHVRFVFTCYNCHINTMLTQKKKIFIPVTGWTFLINYNGKVVAANMQSFVLKDKRTFMLFAPCFSHNVMKKGRSCKECHENKLTQELKNGEVTLTWLKNGKLEHIKGVIPIVKDVNYKLVFFDYENGKWVPFKPTFKTEVQFAGFGKPLTAEQLKKLEMKR